MIWGKGQTTRLIFYLSFLYFPYELAPFQMSSINQSISLPSLVKFIYLFIHLFNLSLQSFWDERLLGQISVCWARSMSSCRARQNQPSTFPLCMITMAMHAVVIESECYISYVNFKALHVAGNASLNYWSRTEWAWMIVWLSFWGSSSLFSSQLLLCKSGCSGDGMVVVVVLIVVPMLLLHSILSSSFSECCEGMLQEKPQASFLLEMNWAVFPER